ncbi:NAD-dependent epimerase/dehydratase family protein [Chryseobacterium sp. MYb264]|uniref:NAD-dependent epimerase/dehydratase family protein n=1 Tax=Chryseobacterium sp. MYb264 TaxID=2745153 RepID=UPI002E154FBC|nr:NAD-dependent epimerase/dehydratase family protein [Chryseobacterium sp. MYb264]
MKILITGANGYLGRYLKNELEGDFEIITPDLRKTGFEDFKESDVIINCIGKTGDGEKNIPYEQYLESNFNSVVKLYDFFEKSDAQLLIHFSSIAAVEELMSDSNLSEDAPCNPISHYGITKRKAEEFLLEKINFTDKKITLLRPTRIHGPQDKGTIFQLYNFLRKGIPYPFASYDNNRSFLAVDNLVFFIKGIISKKKTIPSGIYNVNDDEGLSTLEIIESFRQHGEIKVKKLFIPRFVFGTFAKIGDMLKLPFNSNTLGKITMSRIVSNSKIKNALGIEKLPVSAKEGLIKTIKSFQLK